MKVSLNENDWLTDETKEKALNKLSKFGIKIGYPDEWKNYDDLKIKESDTLYEIRKKVIRFEYENEFLEKINSPVDKLEWHMTPQTVNAYFSPQLNEIVFPAAILQPPFYHKSEETIDFPIEQHIRDYCKKHNLDMVLPVNLGGIGAVIAHEITHGYDDKGRKFDGNGNLENWWNNKDFELFKKKKMLAILIHTIFKKI
jgi:endothelin-converting enzyme